MKILIIYIFFDPVYIMTRKDDYDMPTSPTLSIHYRSDKGMTVLRVWLTNIFGLCPAFGHLPPKPPLLLTNDLKNVEKWGNDNLTKFNQEKTT